MIDFEIKRLPETADGLNALGIFYRVS